MQLSEKLAELGIDREAYTTRRFCDALASFYPSVEWTADHHTMAESLYHSDTERYHDMGRLSDRGIPHLYAASAHEAAVVWDAVGRPIADYEGLTFAEWSERQKVFGR